MLILDSAIFEKIMTDAAVINSIIKKEYLGSTQARRKGDKRSRCTLYLLMPSTTNSKIEYLKVQITSSSNRPYLR